MSMDDFRLLVVLAARARGIPYVRSRCRPVVTGGPDPAYGYEVGRRRRQAASSFVVRPDPTAQADDGLSLEFTARFGVRTRFAGRTTFPPISHRPWPLQLAELVHLDDELLGAVGLDVQGPSGSVVFFPGVPTLFDEPWAVPTS